VVDRKGILKDIAGSLLNKKAQREKKKCAGVGIDGVFMGAVSKTPLRTVCGIRQSLRRLLKGDSKRAHRASYGRFWGRIFTCTDQEWVMSRLEGNERIEKGKKRSGESRKFRKKGMSCRKMDTDSLEGQR